MRTIPANEGRRPRRTDALDHRTNAIVGRKPARTHDIRCGAALKGSLRRKEFVAGDRLQSRLVSLANSGRAALYLRCRQRVTGAINHETCFMPRSGRFWGHRHHSALRRFGAHRPRGGGAGRERRRRPLCERLPDGRAPDRKRSRLSTRPGASAAAAADRLRVVSAAQAEQAGAP